MRSRDVRLYLVGLTASVIGTSAMTLVAGIWVKTLTGSDSAAALVSLCVLVPTLLAPLAGIVADRVPRRGCWCWSTCAPGSGCCPCWP